MTELEIFSISLTGSLSRFSCDKFGVLDDVPLVLEMVRDCCNIARSPFVAYKMNWSYVLGAVLLVFQYKARVLKLHVDKI